VLAGPPPSEDFYLPVSMTVDAGGRIRDVKARLAKDAERVASLRTRIVGVPIVAGNPDKASFTLARGGTVSCFKVTMCYLGIEILADQTWVLEQ
jgi:hypothetical protein